MRKLIVKEYVNGEESRADQEKAKKGIERLFCEEQITGEEKEQAILQVEKGVDQITLRTLKNRRGDKLRWLLNLEKD